MFLVTRFELGFFALRGVLKNWSAQAGLLFLAHSLVVSQRPVPLLTLLATIPNTLAGSTPGHFWREILFICGAKNCIGRYCLLFPQ
jgi:hypothetical protein